ncbi:MAG: lysylphosphatidylglycerol synthase transmembrane domain-containing protein [Desulfuromonadales bacterium]
MGLLKRLPTVIGPILLAYIFTRYINISEVVKIFKNASLSFLLASCLFNTLLLYGKIHRLYFMLKKSSISVGFFCLSKTYATSNFLGQISNVFVSDIVNAGVLMMQNEKKMRISNIFVFNRIADLLSVILLFVIFLAMNIKLLKNYLDVNYKPVILFSCILMIILPCALFFRSRFLLVWMDLRQVVKETLTVVFLYSGFIYFFYCLSAVCDAMALHLGMPKSYILLSYMMGSLITVVPISVAGIGTRDFLFIFLMSLVAIAPEKAVALSALGFIIIPYVSLFIIYAISLIGIRYENRCHC